MKKEYESIEECIHDAKKTSMNILLHRDKTEVELRKKLIEKGFPESVIEEAIKYVKSYKYIDDQRYAKNYIRSNKEDKSKKLISIELLNKGVSDDDIDIALLSEYDISEVQVISGLVEKKRYDKETADEKETRRMVSYLMRRGFQYDDIKKVIMK